AVEQKEEDFVTLFSYFSIFISNGFNVYSALKETLPYCPKSIKPELAKLVDGIDQDKSVAPFLIFSTQFSSLSIKEVLLSVYQMVDEGGGEAHLARFTYLFRALSEDKRKAKKNRESAQLSSLSSFPLMGSGIAMLMLTAALSQIMGGLFNVV
ncbi:MAG: hypothetical protein MJ239_06065, partial [Bacilli bacterium]|nr:hypothetical protein [Bacilli bacterium]